MNQPWLETYLKYNMQTQITLPSDNSSLLDIFENSFSQFSNREVMYFMGKTMSFKELDQHSKQVASYLQSTGLKRGDRVGVMLPNIFQYPVIALGILRAGYILVNINPLYTKRELHHQLSDSGCKVLFILENFADVYASIKEKTVDQVVICKVGDMLGFKGHIVNAVLKYVKKQIPSYSLPQAMSFKDLMKTRTRAYQRPDMNLDDVAVLQYTGGTTGLSKGATLTHKNLVANLLQADAFLGDSLRVDGQATILTALPLYHIFSFTVCLLSGLYRGDRNALIANPRDIEGLVKEIANTKPAMIPAVNTLFNALVHNENFKNLDFSSLKIAMGGGMSVQPSVAKAWKDITGVFILEGYGLSETSPIATAVPPSTGYYTGNIGVPFPSTDVAILDDAGVEVAIGERGEISIRGPQVMQGYWNNPEATEKTMTKDGFFKTGDIGVMDEAGFVKIVDRKKDMILVSGFNVYPNELESTVAAHPKVLEVGAIGIPDEKSGEVPKLFIVKKDASLTEQEVLDFCRQELTGYKQPKEIEFIDELPKSNVGKILRKDLRKLQGLD